jgi:YD repeat-containing protein
MRASVDAGTGKVTIIGENGCHTYFTPSSGSYIAAPRVSSTLVHNGDGTWTFERADGSTFLFEPDDATTLGRLREVTDRNGYKTALAYSTGREISTITDDTSGRALTIVWTGSRISSVRDKPVGDPTGRSVQYSYDGAGDLTQVTDVSGKRWQFGYDGSHRLTDVYSPEQVESGTMKSTHNTYDAQGRVTRQTSPLSLRPTWPTRRGSTTRRSPAQPKSPTPLATNGSTLTRRV